MADSSSQPTNPDAFTCTNATSSSSKSSSSAQITVQPPAPLPHTKYYYPDGNVIFVAENTLFRVHRFFFERESEAFRTIFTRCPNLTRAQGGIRLPQCTSKEFESLLWIFYNEQYGEYTASKETWKSVMALSSRWKMANVFSLAKKHIPLLLDDPIEQIELQIKYRIEPEWALDAYVKLAQRRVPFSLEEAKRLGFESMVILQMTNIVPRPSSLRDLLLSAMQEVYVKGRAERARSPVIDPADMDTSQKSLTPAKRVRGSEYSGPNLRNPTQAAEQAGSRSTTCTPEGFQNASQENYTEDLTSIPAFTAEDIGVALERVKSERSQGIHMDKTPSGSASLELSPSASSGCRPSGLPSPQSRVSPAPSPRKRRKIIFE